MSKIKQYNSLIYEYEKKYADENLALHKKCLQELIEHDKKYKEKISNIYGDAEEKLNTLHLEILREQKDIMIFYKILEKYKYNPATAILWFICDICDITYIPTEEYLISLFEMSPYIEKIEKKGNLFTIHSIIGTFTFEKIINYLTLLNNKILLEFYKKRCIPGYCHFNTEKIVGILKDSIATTGIYNAPFRGTFYHSFSIYKEKCIDPNFSCVISYQQYIELLKGIILNQITHDELKEQLRKKEEQPFEFLLCNTLDKQIQKRKIKV